jgi:hypothetical protein
MNNKLNKWLNMPLEKGENILIPPVSTYKTANKYNLDDFHIYYTENNEKDIDIKIANDKLYLFNFPEASKSIEDYGDNKQILIPQNSNHAHCSFLFKLLVNTIHDEKIYLDVPIIYKNNLIEYFKEPIFDKSMKDKFYEFCMKNSNT